MKKYLLLCAALLQIGSVEASSIQEFKFQDCVEVIGGFYDKPDQRDLGRVWDVQGSGDTAKYRVGNVLFGFWIEAYNLTKVDDKLCIEAEKAEESK